MTERCDPPHCVRVLGHDGECRPTWFGFERCGFVVRLGVVCARSVGHAAEHKTRRQLDTDAKRQARFKARRQLGDKTLPPERDASDDGRVQDRVAA